MLHLFHRHVLHINLGWLPDAVRAKRPNRVIGLLRGDT